MARNEVWLLIAAGVVLLLVLPSMVFAPFTYMGDGDMEHWMMGSRMMVSWWPFMFLLPSAFLAFVALGIYYLFSGDRPSRGYGETDALRMLKERYARGEMTSEQYEKMKKELES
jgi:putative membrane protein